MQPIVSVIVPTYNRGNYLKKAISSVLSQTFKDFEIIVINNYSTDNTLEVINQFKDSRIKVINFKNEGIIAKSRNQGICQSTGKYIAFLDDDDLWISDKLQVQVKYLEENPICGMVYSNVFKIDENDGKHGLLLIPKQLKNGRIFSYLVHENIIPILSVLMKREVVQQIGLFNEDVAIKAAEDYEYWLRISLHFDICYIDKVLASYRTHSECVSGATNRPLKWQIVLSRFLDAPDVSENDRTEIVRNIERFNSDVAVYYWSISDKVNARVYAKKYIRFHFKILKIFNVIIGIFLYAFISFQYGKCVKIVNFAASIRKPLGL
jgi:glycosyltransferase involved in cell wall biosynthesis